MSDLDAYKDEMRRLGRLDDRDIDRLLAGNAPSRRPELEELAVFLRATRARLEATPDPEVEARHLRAMAAESTGAERRSAPSDLPMLRVAVRLSVAMLVLVLGTAGLAVAGVELPEPAEDAFDRFGVSLPNQGAGGGAGAEKRQPSDGGRGESGPNGRSDGAIGGDRRGHAVGERSRTPAAGAPPRTRSDDGAGRGVDRGDEGARRGAEHGQEGARQGAERGQEGAQQGADRGQEGAQQGADRGQEGAQRGQEGAQQGAQRGAEGMQRGREGAERGGTGAERPAGPPQGTPPTSEGQPGVGVPAPGSGSGPPTGAGGNAGGPPPDAPLNGETP